MNNHLKYKINEFYLNNSQNNQIPKYLLNKTELIKINNNNNNNKSVINKININKNSTNSTEKEDYFESKQKFKDKMANKMKPNINLIRFLNSSQHQNKYYEDKKELQNKILNQVEEISHKYYNNSVNKTESNSNDNSINNINIKDFCISDNKSKKLRNNPLAMSYEKNKIYNSNSNRINGKFRSNCSARNIKKKEEDSLNDIKMLQEIYHQINDKNNGDSGIKEKNSFGRVVCGYGDYAVNKTIFNHPQLYLISNNYSCSRYDNRNKNNKLPPLNLKYGFEFKRANNFEKLIPNVNSNNKTSMRKNYFEFIMGGGFNNKKFKI